MDQNHRIVTVSLNPAVDRTVQVEDFRIGRHQTGRTVSRCAGGKAINVSRVLAGMGISGTALGILGRDNLFLFESAMEGPLIENRMLVLDGSTRENVTVTDPLSNVDTHIRDVGLEVDEDAKAQLRERLLQCIQEDWLVVFSGSLPPGYRPQDQAELVRACAQAGARPVVDTSGEALKAIHGQGAYLLCPNRQELAELTGQDPQSPQEVVESFGASSGWAPYLLCSLGPDGAVWAGPDGAWHARCTVENKEIVNTVGCGDTLLGAFLGAQATAAPPEEALPFAVATATASALTATAGTFDQDRRDALLRQTFCRRIDRS
jgi:1-phosphofructokinase